MKVLIADDNVVMRNLLKFYLSSEYGWFRIFEAVNGVETLKTMKEEEIDILLLDINMPELDGFNVANYVRTYSEKTTVISISSTMTGEYKKIFRALGVNYFMNKPVDKKVLMDIMNKIVKDYRENNEMDDEMDDELADIVSDMLKSKQLKDDKELEELATTQTNS